jgi:hypothetical protein
VSAPTVCRWLQRLGLPRKKKSLHASEQDTPRVQALRAAWRRICRRWDPQKLVFVDESGLSIAMTRLYGRAPRGQRVIGSVPQNYGQPLTVLAALDRHGMRASMTDTARSAV